MFPTFSIEKIGWLVYNIYYKYGGVMVSTLYWKYK